MMKLPGRYRRAGSLLLEEIREKYGENLVSLAVFGSVARGVATPESDLDLLIVAEKLVRGRMSRMREFMEMEKEILLRYPDLRGVDVSPIIKTPEEVELGSPLF